MDFVATLREKNLKITPQRLAILEEIKSHGHSSVDEIFHKIKHKIPSVSLATVYKNILSLQNIGVLKSVKTPTQKQKYELNTMPHIHLFCKNCEKLEDFEIDIDELKTRCAASSGYSYIEETSIILSGICSLCAGKTKPINR